MSEVLALLGLVAVSVAASAIAAFLITSYLTRTAQPSYQVSASGAKLVLLSTYEVVGGTAYMTLKAEVGVANTGSAVPIQICVVSASVNPSGVGSSGYLGCAQVVAERGFKVYSAVVRIPVSTVVSLGCTWSLQDCPNALDWYIAVVPPSGQASLVKPAYVVP